jgi:hypothetical protein
LERIAGVDGTPVLPHLTQAHKEVGMRIVSVVRQLDDRVPDYLQRFSQRQTGKGQDIISLLKLPVVAVTASCWIDYPAADSWSGIRGIADERRRTTVAVGWV